MTLDVSEPASTLSNLQSFGSRNEDEAQNVMRKWKTTSSLGGRQLRKIWKQFVSLFNQIFDWFSEWYLELPTFTKTLHENFAGGSRPKKVPSKSAKMVPRILIPQKKNGVCNFAPICWSTLGWFDCPQNKIYATMNLFFCHSRLLKNLTAIKIFIRK